MEPPPVQRLWLRTSRTGTARFLSHLEALNAWLRALRRARVSLSFSQGFHPHPKVAFSSALPHNTQSMGEYMDLTLTARCSPDELVARLSRVLPEGFGVHAAREVPLDAPSLMSLNHGEDLVIALPHETAETLAERVAAIASADRLVVERIRKSDRKSRGARPRPIDVRSSVLWVAARPGTTTVDARLVVMHDGQSCKSRDLVGWLTDAPDRAIVVRKDTLTRGEDGYVSLSAG
jgi:radical SAM-linked protein